MRLPITGFSRQSQERLKHYLRNIVKQKYFLTLTYPSGSFMDGAVIKKHLNAFIRWLKGQRVVQGVWVLESQARGTPHYHLIFSERLDFALCAKQWARIIGVKDCQSCTHLKSIRHWQKTVNYLAKALSKELPEDFVNVGRWWGKWGGLKPEPVMVITDQEEAVQAARYLRRASEKKGGRRKSDRGYYKRTHYGVGKSAAENLPRLRE